jgi:hypothetical protein
VLTNVAAGVAIVIPEFALLANDSDVDGPLALDITALSAAAGVTGLSLATNAGSVTLVDDATLGGSFAYTVSDGSAVNGSSNATVTLTRQGPLLGQLADNFNGAGNVRSGANNSTGTTAWTSGWIEAADDNNIRAGQVQIDGGANNGTNDLRFVTGDGASLTRAVNLAGATSATLSFAFDKNGIDVGEFVQVQFSADGSEAGFANVTNGLITNVNNTNASGNAAGTLNLTLTGAFSATSAIRFVSSAISGPNEDIRIDNVAVNYTAANPTLTGTAAGEVLAGNANGTNFSGLGGNDRIFAGGGDDTISWSVGDGRDFVDGGANDLLGDRFVVNGDNSVEAYIVYTSTAAGLAGITGLNSATEMVITRNGAVIAELDNIEEVTINTSGGADSTAAIGDFGTTSLFFNTITVNGGGGSDTINASLLTSAHKLVLNQDVTAVPVQLVTDHFAGIGQAMMDQLARQGLLDRFDDANGFIGSRSHGIFAATLFAPDQDLGLHFNPMFARELAMDGTINDFGHDQRSLNQALHFDAADHLIS